MGDGPMGTENKENPQPNGASNANVPGRGWATFNWVQCEDGTMLNMAHVAKLEVFMYGMEIWQVRAYTNGGELHTIKAYPTEKEANASLVTGPV